jgi:membrane associated rhomboid family serine protease
MVQDQVRSLVNETSARVSLIAKSTALLWLVELIDRLLFRGALDSFGVWPRSIEGLVGIVFAPFLHANWGHLIANTVPFVVLGFLTTARKRMDFHVVFASSALSAGLACWLLGATNSVHIGASGVVFGFLGFLMGRGLFERRLGTILLSLVVTFLFGGMLWGVLPVLAGPGISWQAHLGGWIGGLLTARALGGALRKGK